MMLITTTMMMMMITGVEYSSSQGGHNGDRGNCSCTGSSVFLDFRSWKNLSQPPLSSHSGNIRRLGNRRQGKRQDHWFDNIFIFFITITISGLMQWWFGPNSDMSRWKVTMASVWFIHQYINTLIFSLVWPIIVIPPIASGRTLAEDLRFKILKS